MGRSRREQRRRRVRRRSAARGKPGTAGWLERHAHQLTLVGIVVTIAGIVVGLVALLGASGSSDHPAAARRARAVVRLLPPDTNAVVPKAADQLDRPPSYPADQRSDHCALWWRRWLPTQQAALVGADPLVEVRAPAQAPVTVTAARVEVFRSWRPPTQSLVECVTGAGPSPGTLLNLDLVHPNARPTIVADDGRDEPLALPDAVIAVGRGRTEDIALSPIGAQRFYEWAVTLTLVVDQRSQTATFGSRARPFRSWLGPVPARAVNYDFRTRVWRRSG
jgi:hypothetical protein